MKWKNRDRSRVALAWLWGWFRSWFWRPGWKCGYAVILLAGAGLMVAQQTAQQPYSGSTPAQEPGQGHASNAATPTVPSAQGGMQNPVAVNADRKKQIADEGAALLKLATDLKTEVDKTTRDTLSLTVIHKAEEIEKLAHSVKEQTKVTVGSN
jgi:xanthine dehydrogenase iron-sulfur cluster and FAD-binding subunit A